MPTPKLSSALAQEAVDAFAKYADQTKAAAALGLPRPTYQARLREAQQRGVKPSPGVEDANNIEHVRAKLKRTEADLRAARSKVLTEDTIRAEVFKLVQGG